MGPVAVINRKTATSVFVPRLLLLEQDGAEAETILRELQEGGLEVCPIVARNAAEFGEALRSREFDVALVDCASRNGEYPEAVEMLRGTGRETPFVLLTETPEEAAASECIKCGASDYILKGRMTRLPFAVKRALDEQKLLQESARIRSALKESETRAHDLIQNATYGIFRVGLDGVLQSGNETLKKILAYSSDSEMQSLNLAGEVFRYAETFPQLVNDCRANGMVHNTETEWRRRDGGFVAVRLRLRYISNGGPDDRIEGTVEDVTEVRALERQLQQAQKFETIGQLAGGIAHDFNNVLGAVIGWAELGYD